MKYLVTFDSDQYPNEIMLHADLMSMYGGPLHPIHIESVPEDLIDQGITRLQLLAFLRGDKSDVWNGADNQGGTRWVRYRAHQVERIPTPDGNWVQLCHIEHDGTLRAAEWTLSTSDEDALVTARMVDQIIDAAIAHHGPDGVA